MCHTARSLRVLNSYVEIIFFSDQDDIWYGLWQLIQKAGTHSTHGAMRDVYQQKRIKLNRHCKAFPVQTGQQGLLVLHKNKPLGFDLVSSPEIYRQNHCKLVKSYVLDSLLEKPRRAITPSRASAIAGEFLIQANEAKPKRFASPGLGSVVQANANGMIGSVLIHEEAPIHTTFLTKPKIEPLISQDFELPDLPPLPGIAPSTLNLLFDPYWDPTA